MLYSKAQLTALFRDKTQAIGGAFSGIGGDCYAASVEGEIRAAVAIKESNALDKLWVGSPQPILNLVTGVVRPRGTEEPIDLLPLYRAFIALTHIPHKTVLLISIFHVYKDIVERARANRATEYRMDFDIKRVGYKRYVIQTDQFLSDIPITVVDSFEPFEKAWRIPLSEL